MLGFVFVFLICYFLIVVTLVAVIPEGRYSVSEWTGPTGTLSFGFPPSAQQWKFKILFLPWFGFSLHPGRCSAVGR